MGMESAGRPLCSKMLEDMQRQKTSRSRLSLCRLGCPRWSTLVRSLWLYHSTSVNLYVRSLNYLGYGFQTGVEHTVRPVKNLGDQIPFLPLRDVWCEPLDDAGHKPNLD